MTMDVECADEDIQVPVNVPTLVEDDFEVASKGRIFLGKDTIEELGIEGDVGTGELNGESVYVDLETDHTFVGGIVCRREMDGRFRLQRDGEFTIPAEARRYLGIEKGDTVHLRVIS